MIKTALQELGLTSNEAEVYLTLLRSASISVNEIAEKSGLHRQVCYDALERLLEKGFVTFLVENNKKYFQALSPDRIVDYLEKKKESFQQILPDLKEITLLPKEQTKIEVVKGKNVIRIILRDVIKCLQENKGELLMWGVDESKFLEEDKIAIEQYLRDLQRYKLKERLLAREGAKVFFSGMNSSYRLVNKEYFNPNPVYIYSGKVVQVIWGEPLHAIIISNSEIYDSYKKHFELLWKIAKK